MEACASAASEMIRHLAPSPPQPDAYQGGTSEPLYAVVADLFMMVPGIEDEGRNLELAKARSRAGSVRAELDAHRGSAVPRGQHWKVKEALCLQQLEEAQSRLMSLTRPLRAEAPAQGLVPAAKRFERAVRSRLSRLLASRRTRTAEKPSHSRGRG